MSSVTGTTRKKAKAVTALEKWRRAGVVLDKRARVYMARRNVDYSAALNAVLKKDKALRKVYLRPPSDKGAKTLDQLKDLAEYLNEHKQDPLAMALRAFKHADATETDIEAATPILEHKLSALHVEFVPLIEGKRISFGYIYPADHCGTIARALRDGLFSALHCCRWCKTFFVDRDYRKDYCSGNCFKDREVYRVKLWRASKD